MSIPNWAKKYLKSDDLQKVSHAIFEAEKKTSAEIVPMVVRQSAATGHVPLVAGLIATSLFMSLDLIFDFQGILSRHDIWLVLVAELALVYATIRFFMALPVLRRYLSDEADLTWQTHMRAEVEFFRNGLQKTTGSTGILLFISLMERKAVVLADKSIAQKLPPEEWNKVVQLLIDGVKRDDLAGGFVDAVRSCQQLVTPHFPHAKNDKNELSNRLVIKD